MRTSIAVVSATRKPQAVKNEDDEDEQDYSAPPSKVKRDAFSFVSSGKKPPAGCGTCFFFDKPNGECELFEAVQEESPDLFSLDKKVTANAGCLAHVTKAKGK